MSRPARVIASLVLAIAAVWAPARAQAPPADAQFTAMLGIVEAEPEPPWT